MSDEGKTRRRKTIVLTLESSGEEDEMDKSNRDKQLQTQSKGPDSVEADVVVEKQQPLGRRRHGMQKDGSSSAAARKRMRRQNKGRRGAIKRARTNQTIQQEDQSSDEDVNNHGVAATAVMMEEPSPVPEIVKTERRADDEDDHDDDDIQTTTTKSRIETPHHPTANDDDDEVPRPHEPGGGIEANQHSSDSSEPNSSVFTKLQTKATDWSKLDAIMVNFHRPKNQVWPATVLMN